MAEKEKSDRKVVAYVVDAGVCEPYPGDRSAWMNNARLSAAGELQMTLASARLIHEIQHCGVRVVGRRASMVQRARSSAIVIGMICELPALVTRPQLAPADPEGFVRVFQEWRQHHEGREPMLSEMYEWCGERLRAEGELLFKFVEEEVGLLADGEALMFVAQEPFISLAAAYGQRTWPPVPQILEVGEILRFGFSYGSESIPRLQVNSLPLPPLLQAA